MSTRALSVLIAGLFTLQLAACGGTGHESVVDSAGTAPAGGLASQPGRGLPSLGQLDALASARDRGAARSSSAICNIGNIFPPDRLAESNNIIHNPDNSYTLAAVPGGLEWMVFEAFNGGTEVINAVFFGSTLKPGVFLARADFSRGRWELLGPDPATQLAGGLDLDEPRFYSPLHRQYFAILATDGAQYNLDSILTNIKCLVPQASIIAPSVASGVELVDCGGLPGISYVDSANRLVFALAKDTEPAGPLDWRTSIIDDVNYGTIQSLTMHQGKPVILYASANDFSLWIAAASVAAPTKDADWQHMQIFAAATCYYCSVTSSGSQLHLAWYEDDPVDSDLDGFWAYLHYAASDTTDPLGSYNDYRLAAMGNGIYAEYSRPDIAIIDGSPAIAIANMLPGDGSYVNFYQSTIANPQLLDWKMQDFNHNALTPFVKLIELNSRPLILYRGDILRGFGGKVTHPQSLSDWNFSDMSGTSPFESFDIMSIWGRPYYGFVSDLAGPFQIAYTGCSPSRFIPRDDVIEEIQTLSFNQFETIGNPDMRMANIGGQPVIVYYEPADGKLNYVQLVID